MPRATAWVEFIVSDLKKIKVEKSVVCDTQLCSSVKFEQAFRKAFDDLSKKIPTCRSN